MEKYHKHSLNSLGIINYEEDGDPYMPSTIVTYRDGSTKSFRMSISAFEDWLDDFEDWVN